MSPRKKARRPSRAAASPSGNAIEDALTTRDTNTKTPDKSHTPQADPWTDDQEAVLFKGVIRWKPVGRFPCFCDISFQSIAATKSLGGVHKHFRMIALSQHLQSHGYTPSEHEHTRISGIWKKLGGLYNLEALDDRENAFSRASSPDGEESEMPSHQFTLPKDEYGKMMFDRRLAPEGSSSPPASTRPPSADSTSMAATGRASTIEDTEDLRSSPASMRGARTTGSARQTRSTRRSQLHEVSSLPTQQRSSGKRVSPRGDSIDAPDVEAAEAPEADQKSEAGASNAAQKRGSRRRSGRRK
ncbi:MAG: hypothetical protein LQ339_003499 [Xanthoria mediterranea]|nr:MAG: hypothetical protein LQ339_003499 [Xanthoria mediterranea]